MSDRYFLDTNILLYTFDKRYPAKRLIGHGLEVGAAFISYQVIQEFYNAMCKRFPAAQSPRDAEAYLETVLFPLLAVESSVVLFKEALAIHGRYKLSCTTALSWQRPSSLIAPSSTRKTCSTDSASETSS